jgi:hypothetical protein
MASLGESECSILSGFLEDLEAKKRSDYKERCGIMAAQIYFKLVIFQFLLLDLNLHCTELPKLV